MKCSEYANLETESRLVVAWRGQRGEGRIGNEVTAKRNEVSFKGDENILKLIVVMTVQP